MATLSDLKTMTEKPQNLILTLDTSSPRASLAIGYGDNLLAQMGISGNERRSSNLLSEIDYLLARAGLSIKDIAAFAVIVGPGSFTGLRVGIATIKGFAHALGCPVIALKSTEVLARIAGTTNCSAVLLDAHRSEVFAQLFNVDENGQVKELCDLLIGKVEKILSVFYEYQQEENLPRMIFVGDGVNLHKEVLLDYASKNSLQIHQAKLLTANNLGWILHRPINFLALEAALYAQEKFALGETISADELSAYYVRPAEAEVKLQLGLIGKKKSNLS
ncbi:MAG: tRNA (adenosine(37)-N6)-threonylcarbamoyltransferase complex dimerization subunit type 1 TsaB [Blastocatellia bacterium]|nr:tRNA (adenosine(37)-N6)-threonylcarbamoyltransferase complex dimerization subunit type 1 TsaB [Blastocatellia bacterium]MBL8195473.1 tRNA (adenosine(37)-N6)-threonylcarbamoyltransferase complex dimerization subunit type 1 TsaB [Blastocatellia bacterium]